MTHLLNERFEITETLAEGGMGIVYKGIDQQSGSAVAIKKLKHEVVSKYPEQLERFKREALVLYHLNHPNIVRVIDAIVYDGDYYIVMDFIEGGSLRDWLNREKRLPIQDCVSIGLDIADALARAHRLKVIHRDMKPDNILLTAQGIPHLTDFGQAHVADATGLTRAGQVIGTLNYMPPEVLGGKPADRRSDIWSLGVTMYEMISGFRPFMGENAAQIITAIMRQPVPDIRKLRPDCPTRLADTVHRMLEKERDNRIFSVREVGLQLEYTLFEIDPTMTIV
jgi:serine/threonine protein kinase